MTGKRSAEECGALADIKRALEENGTEYMHFNKVENNPSVENVSAGAKAASDFKADFIIGIGGGSPIDAAKAIAVLAANNIDPSELFNNAFPKSSLPVVAIPTTAGTGSEVTQYSILTRKDMNTKMGFGNEQTFPKLAFMDARYTESLSAEVTKNTAVDALSHAVEGYLSRRSTPLSDALALESIEIFGKNIDKLMEGQFDYEARESLLYMAMIAGMVIAQTGTTIVHGMGYSLTYFKGIPHGKANGILMKEYLKYNYSEAGRKIDNMLQVLNTDDLDEFGDTVKRMLFISKQDLYCTNEEINKFAALTMKQKSTLSNIREVRVEDIIEIYNKSLK